MSKPSVSRSVQTLWDLGLLTTRGLGEPTALRVDHPIVSPLLQLFDAERKRVEYVYRGLRDAFEAAAMSVWIEGKVPRGEDGPEDPLQVGVLVDAAKLDQLRDSVESRIAELEKTAAVMIEVKYYTRADLAAMTPRRSRELASVLPLTGVAPSAFVQGSPGEQLKRTHLDRDQDALERARALVQLIQSEPTLVPRALAWVRDQLRSAGPGVARSLREWERILVAATPAQLRRLLTDDSERAIRLRQSNPFFPILSHEERRTLHERLEAE